jgi:hypothetical protein
MAAVTTENFAKLFLDALSLKETEPIYQKIMRPIIEPMFEEFMQQTDKKMQAMNDVINQHESRISELEAQIDQNDQDSRATKAVITGIQVNKDEVTNITNLVKFFDKTMQVNLDKSDITDAHSISQNGKTMLVTFSNPVVKRRIFKEKKKLKQSAAVVYINDSLTKRRASLFKKARDLVKTKSVAAAWSSNGNIIIKGGENDKPTRITKEQDLEQYLKVKIMVSSKEVEKHLGLNLHTPARTSTPTRTY